MRTSIDDLSQRLSSLERAIQRKDVELKDTRQDLRKRQTELKVEEGELFEAHVKVQDKEHELKREIANREHAAEALRNMPAGKGSMSPRSVVDLLQVRNHEQD